MCSFQSSHLISSSSSIVLCAGASHSTKPFLYPPAASILLASKISPLAVGLSPCWLCSASSCLAHFSLLHLRVVIRSNEGCLHSSDIEFPVMCAKHRAFHPLSVERSESSRHHDSNPCVITDTTAAPNKFSLAGCAKSDFQIFIMLPNTDFATKSHSHYCCVLVITVGLEVGS